MQGLDNNVSQNFQKSADNMIYNNNRNGKVDLINIYIGYPNQKPKLNELEQLNGTKSKLIPNASQKSSCTHWTNGWLLLIVILKTNTTKLLCCMNYVWYIFLLL